MAHDTSFTSARRTAAQLGVPIAWLKAEAEAGRVPHLKIGRRLLFNVEDVKQALLDRAHALGEEGRCAHG